jgi:3-hydroxybutyryl-CoA dehydrogenase
MTAALPADRGARPVAVIGCGTLGRRIATVYAAAGSDVRIHDASAEQRAAGRAFIAATTAAMAAGLGLEPRPPGDVHVAAELADAVAGAWMVVEAVPEDVELKTALFGELDRLCDPSVLLCSNASSLASSRFVARVRHRARVLNTHYQMPPLHNAVELMSCGETAAGVIDALMEELPQYGLVPFRVRRESDGFIFNRIWAAIKRECLLVVAEEVAAPEDVDALWRIFVRGGIAPFERMDRIGLDVVLAIEEHYAAVRDGIPEEPRALLRRYVERGDLGEKSGRGFFDHAP